ncbi:MAG: transglutaminase domain-containing protein [Planctomycetes bacterium]|nr:transglutaminase domain-containing protein [Planctomycetota bacterium]
MKHYAVVLFAVMLLLAGACRHDGSVTGARLVRINCQMTLKNQPDESSEVKIWMPVPRQTPFQKVSELKVNNGRLYSEPEYGNQLIYLDEKGAAPEPGGIGFSCLVERLEQNAYEVDTENPAVLDKFLLPNRLVTMSPRVKELAGQISSSQTDYLAKARAIYDYVLQKMKYDKSQPFCAIGDTEFALDAGIGNCTNFHSLFISLARASGIPAKFVIGYPLPGEKHGTLTGYHCWVEFYVPYSASHRGRWVPVDASEAWKNPDKREYFFGAVDENRILFTEGRDITLAPPQKSAPLNYFVYPYVEINGRPSEEYELKITYDDSKR